LLLTRDDKTLANEEKKKLASQVELLRLMLEGPMPSDSWKKSLSYQLRTLLDAGLDFELDLVPAVQEAICDCKIHDDVRGISWFGARAKVFRQERIDFGEGLAVARAKHLQVNFDQIRSQLAPFLPIAGVMETRNQDLARAREHPADSQAARVFEILGWRSPSNEHWHWFTKGLAELSSKGWDFEDDIVPLIADAVEHGEVPDNIKTVLWFVKTQDRRLRRRAGRLPGI
jgi:hypothetical protein